jgi:hypothetical protein
MLALYDAAEGALRRADDDFDVTELYEQLLSSFARREVGKTHSMPSPTRTRPPSSSRSCNACRSWPSPS